MRAPLELMRRLAALLPRPRLHLMRFHGVLAPNAKLRSQVVPQGPERAAMRGDMRPLGTPSPRPRMTARRPVPTMSRPSVARACPARGARHLTWEPKS